MVGWKDGGSELGRGHWRIDDLQLGSRLACEQWSRFQVGSEC